MVWLIFRETPPKSVIGFYPDIIASGCVGWERSFDAAQQCATRLNGTAYEYNNINGVWYLVQSKFEK